MRSEALIGELEGLRALARSLVHGDADADDLVQDTAAVALAHPPADQERPVRGWLATVLRNRWRMDRRTASRRQAHEVAEVLESDRAEPEAALDRARALEKLSAALVALDEPFRTTVIRRYLDGETAADIARALGIPAGTVRWRLKIGLERLRAALDTSSPTWQRALAPFISLSGAAMKTKTTTTLIAILVLLLLGVGAVIWKWRGSEPPPPSPAVAQTTPKLAPHETAAPLPTTPTLHDPLPGQGRPAVAAVDAAGGSVSGRVINWSTGDGVDGAELTFTSDGGATTVRTKPDGAFELAPPAPGSFTLSAIAAPGFLPYAPELLHSTVHLVLAKQQAVRGITVFLFPAVDYHGLVVDKQGAPVAGAHVKLLGTPQGEQMIDKLQTEWTSDKAGQFVFHAADDAVLEAVHGNQRGWARLDGSVAITKQMKIAIGDAAALDLTITGRAIDNTGAPLADVLVRADPEDERDAKVPHAIVFATTGPEGTFTLTGLAKVPYELAAETEDHAPTTVPNVAAGSKGVTLTLDRGLPITGAVATSKGDPVPAYTLLVMKRKGTGRELIAARSVVEPRGKFTVRVEKGDYDLIAAASGWAPSPPTKASAGQTDVAVTVSPGGTLKGVVIGEGGKPVQYARIMREAISGGASPQPANAGTVTREDGTFELTGIPPGPLSIRVAAGGYNEKIESGMTVADDEVIGPITIPLTKLAEGEEPKIELVGIGVGLRADGDALLVTKVYPGSGAEAAGIVEGDRVTAVDGVPVTQLGLDGAITRIRGVVGTTVGITVHRGDKDVPLVVERRKLHA